jgi:hypothetical protein
VAALRRGGATVLLGRLHDPTRHLPLPPALRSAVRARVGVVNAAVDDAVAEAGRSRRGGDVHVLDLTAVRGLELRRAWAVDRLHPHAAGHGLLAAHAARVLAAAGLPVAPLQTEPLPRAPGLPAQAWWTARHGAPWLAGHLREVVGPALAR